MGLPGLRVLLSALNEPLDRLAAVPYAGTDLHKIWWLSEEPAAPDCRDGNLQEFGDLVLG